MPELCRTPEHQDAILDGECWKCRKESERLDAIAQFRAERSRRILDLLWDDGRGLQRREARAERERIPGLILEAIPGRFRAGHLEVGFGIGGGTGIGKTQAIAALLTEGLTHWSERVIVPSIQGQWDSRKDFPRVVWSSWPDEVHWLRSNAVNGAEERVERLAMAHLLVLDDLGRERLKGSYTEDWGASQLDHIINSRYRAELPTIWTTNVSQVDLVRLYGAATVRRLIEPNPLSWVTGLKPFNLPGRPA
ncbi:hypothetical protein GETHLI_05570 [Geothrix limicola]|uniref:IstB-like ATP-binding protein domain-containing protein n=1 Tax=Geothrix limicola TaxID=2927978 RepID=A0ABQ5QB60_9BACT|nr:hypothetical protein [Geothrix limicola]GLH72055.1 hypothetical protein GETHLI_05570 [Geothrix limicola]